MSDIFISYSREDQDKARQLAVVLEEQGWSVFSDVKLRGGEFFDDTIEKALNEARCVIVLWSKRSVRSSYVRDEATYALESGKLVPVAIEDVDLPFPFRSIHTLQLIDWDGDPSSAPSRQLLKSVSSILGSSADQINQEAGRTAEEQAEKVAVKANSTSSGALSELDMESKAFAAKTRRLAWRLASGLMSIFGLFLAALLIWYLGPFIAIGGWQPWALAMPRLFTIVGVFAIWILYRLFHPNAKASIATSHKVSDSSMVAEAAVAQTKSQKRAGRHNLITVMRYASVFTLLGGALYAATLLTQSGLSQLSANAGTESLARCTYVPGDGPEMVVVLGDSFEMGDTQGQGFPDEKPVRTVRVATFAMGRCEVTFDEFDAFARATRRESPDDEGWGRGSRPVINVSWDDAVAYAQWLSGETGERYRLPSEAEWEYAARAGTETDFWWGNEIRQAGEVWANCRDCGSEWDSRQTAPVGSFQPNDFGVYDTAGNVWEWVQDCSEAAGGGGDCAPRVIRGGSWFNAPWSLRSAFRNWDYADNRNFSLGFRLARDLE